MPTLEPPCATTGAGDRSIATPPTSSPRSWPVPLADRRECGALPSAGNARTRRIPSATLASTRTVPSGHSQVSCRRALSLSRRQILETLLNRGEIAESCEPLVAVNEGLIPCGGQLLGASQLGYQQPDEFPPAAAKVADVLRTLTAAATLAGRLGSRGTDVIPSSSFHDSPSKP